MGNKAKRRKQKKPATRRTLSKEEKRKIQTEYTQWKRRRDSSQKLIDTEDQRLSEIDMKMALLVKQRAAILEDAKKLPSIVRCHQYQMDKFANQLHKSQERKSKLSKLDMMKARVRKLEAEINDGSDK